MPDEQLPEENPPQEATSPQGEVSQEASSDETTPQDETPQEALPDEAASLGETPQEAPLDETATQETSPDEADPQDETQQEAAPDEADPQDGIAPKEAAPKEVALIEAILFMESESLAEARLCQLSGFPRDLVRGALDALALRYAAEDSGMELSRIGGGVMISPKREHWEDLKDHYGRKNEGRISRAAMETLAIVAYRQPITRAEIKAIRGVSPDNMIQLLMERGFIDRAGGKEDVPGKPMQYKTTKEFLKHFRLDSIADLPRLTDGDLDRFELEGERP